MLPTEIWDTIISFVSIDKRTWDQLSLVSRNVYKALDMQNVSYRPTNIYIVKPNVRYEYIVVKDINDDDEIDNLASRMNAQNIAFINITCCLDIKWAPSCDNIVLMKCEDVHIHVYDSMYLRFISCYDTDSLYVCIFAKDKPCIKCINVKFVSIDQ